MKQKKRTQLNVFGKVPRSKSLVPTGFFKVNTVYKKSKNIKYSKLKPRNNFIFLNNAVPKRPVTSRNNGKMKLFTPVKMQPVSYMAKESINQKRKLNPWGDADMDGSPNKFDCNPRNAAEDGVFARSLGILTGGKYGQSAEEYSSEKAERKQEKKLSKFTAAFTGLEREEREARAARKQFANLAEERITEISKGENIKLSTSQVKQLRAQAGNLIKQEQDKETVIITKSGEVRDPTRLERITIPLKEEGRRFASAFKSSDARRIQEMDREIDRLQSNNKSTFKLREKKEKLKKAIAQKRKKTVSTILSLTTPPGSIPEVKRLFKTSSTSTSEGKGKRGRPKGTFRAGYTVDGVTLSESEFQKLRSEENKKRKSAGMEKVPLGARQFNQAKQAVSRTETPQAVQEQEFEGVVVEEVEQDVNQQPQQPQQPRQPRRPRTLQEAQAQEQQRDNILHAPNFQKGELTQTAGAFQDDPKYNILNAPNFQQGGLRNVGQTEETPAVQVGDRPNPNPYGEEYTDIDPGSGRTIVQRRPNEKWATGEAL